MTSSHPELRLFALPGLPLVRAGDDVAALIQIAAIAAGSPLMNGDVVVVAQKIISKAEGRRVCLADVQPSEAAVTLGITTGKDARQIELVLGESTDVLRARPGVVIVVHRQGWVLANAGIDRSNVAEDDDELLLLPTDADSSAEALRFRLRTLTGAEVAVIIADSIGRAWRLGTIGTAIGASGIACLLDQRGRLDLFGRPLETTETGQADEIAAAASLLMGQSAEGLPVVIVRGMAGVPGTGRAADLIRPAAMDLFR